MSLHHYEKTAAWLCGNWLWVELMPITYTSSLYGITPDHLQGFFSGWPNPPSLETHLNILQGSDEVVLALDGSSGNVVGFITAITDKVISAFIPHLEVLQEHRGNGIGSDLVRKMLERLEHFYSIDLMCDPDVQPFYERLGLKPYSGMLIRNHERQSGARAST